MRLSARSAMRTRQDSRKLSGFGSMWKPGDQLQVFYPIFFDEESGLYDLIVAACWGHSVDPKALGLKRVFVPTTSEIVDGEPKVPDALYQFSRIAPLFVQGELDEKTKSLMEKNMPEAARKTALKKVEDEFENKEPVVGKLRYVISTECVVVPIDQNGNPDIEKIRLVTQDLSDSKINQLLAILSDFKYRPEDKEANYLEVTYTFGSSGDKKQDGKVPPQGVSAEYKIAHRFPDAWPSVEQQLGSLPDNATTVFKRNGNFRAVEESQILTALQTYSVIESGSLDSLTDEDNINRLIRNAAIVSQLQIPVSNEEVIQAVQEYDSAMAVISNSGTTMDGAPTMTTLIEDHKQDVITAREQEEELADNDLQTQASENGVDGVEVDFSKLAAQ